MYECICVSYLSKLWAIWNCHQDSLILTISYGPTLSHSWVRVAHACNPSYSGGRDQEDRGLKPAWGNRPYLEKKSFTKEGWWSDSRCRPWVQAPVLQKEKKAHTSGHLGVGSQSLSSCLKCTHPCGSQFPSCDLYTTTEPDQPIVTYFPAPTLNPRLFLVWSQKNSTWHGLQFKICVHIEFPQCQVLKLTQ
jgi:hypothetical protein